MGGPLVLDRAQARPDRAGRLRAQRARPVPAGGGSTGGPEVRRLVLTASGGPFRGRSRADLAERDPGGGAGAPDLGHGPGDHHQLRDPGQQGPRGDRGAPAVRHPLRPDRGRRAPDERRALDGGVRRRLDARAGQPADHADPDRPRRWPGPTGCPTRRRAVDWTRPQTWEFFPLDDEAFPAVGLAREAGQRGGTAPAVYNAANEVCCRGVPGGRLPFTGSSPRSRRAHRARRTLGGSSSHRRRRPRRRRVGPASGGRAWQRTRDRGGSGLGAVDHGRPALRAGDPGLDRAARARPHDPGEEVRREGHPVLHRLRPDRLEHPARRDRVRRQGVPLGGYVKIVGMLPPGAAELADEVDRRRGRQPGHQGPQVQHRHVHPADLRRPRRGVGAGRSRGQRPAVLQAAVVEEGHRDGRRPDGQHPDRVLHLLGGLRDATATAPRRSTPAARWSPRCPTASSRYEEQRTECTDARPAEPRGRGRPGARRPDHVLQRGRRHRLGPAARADPRQRGRRGGRRLRARRRGSSPATTSTTVELRPDEPGRREPDARSASSASRRRPTRSSPPVARSTRSTRWAG